MKQKVYISGKITNDSNFVKKFKEVQEMLEKAGYTVLSPTVYPEGLTWDEYMHLSYAMIDCADIVCMLQDWRESKGAKLENKYADKNNKIIWYLEVHKAIVTDYTKEYYWKNICEIQEAQLKKGLKKYGFPLEQNPMVAVERLQYLEEELVDALMYIEHIKALFKKEAVSADKSNQ